MNDKVLLAVLKERQSAKGTRYLSGWLGKARIVGFLDREAPEGEVQWQIYAQAPEERQEQQGGGEHARARPQRDQQPRRDQRRPVPAGELDDRMPM